MMEKYKDCITLTLLAQEQRSHLDLAANIGLNLVEKNTQLELRVASLEVQLETSKETMKQMGHQLALKDDLLRIFNSEIADDDEENTPQSENTKGCFSQDTVNVSQLETRLILLEEENNRLRDQQQNVSASTHLLKNSDTQLANDCIGHIVESTKTIDRLSEDLHHKTNAYLSQHEEISRLLASKVDLENKTQNLLSQNEQLITRLRDCQTKEFTLTKEISEMKDRYDECINLLNEKKKEIGRLKKQFGRETFRQSQYYYSSSPEPDFVPSIAMELEESCRGVGAGVDHDHTMRVMDQARLVNAAWLDTDDATSSGFTEDMHSASVNMDHDLCTPEALSGNVLLRRSIQNDCERRRLLTDGDPCTNRRYQPSWRGSVAPSRHVAESRYISEALRQRQNSYSAVQSLYSNTISRSESPTVSQIDRCSRKLQLLKPIQGSQTLRAWQNLAIPSLTKSLFENQPPGVCFRGQQVHLNYTESSPNIEASQVVNGHRESDSSDFDDYDYEDVVNNSRLPGPGSDMMSTNYERVLLKCDDSDTSICDPSSVTDEAAPRHPTEANPVSSVLNPKSWLNVDALLPGLLGYGSQATVGARVHDSVPSSVVGPVDHVTGGGLISRLVSLPALARSRSPQMGLNLLASLAVSPSASSTVHCHGVTHVDD